MTTLYINGKFTAQSMTGVQRTAHEIVLAIDRHLAVEGGRTGFDCVLLCPPQGRPPPLQRIRVRGVGPPSFGLTAWEQVVLPWATRGGWLLSLAGSAPWWSASRTICCLHDAAVFDQPDAYTAAFRRWYRLQFRHLGRRAGGVLTVSEYSRARLCAALGLPPGRVHVVHNGSGHFARVDADRSVLQAHGLVPGRYLLLVGTSKRTKNIEAVLEAWRRLPGRGDRRLVWVGGENSRVFAGHPSNNSPALDVDNGIFRMGVVSDEQLKAFYESAAGLVFASVYEGFGLPVVEAMACGCPVAAAAAASLPEVCGEAALYFEPDRIDAIGNAMQILLNDEPQRRRLGELGRQRAARFDWDRSAEAVLSYAEGLWRGDPRAS